MESEQHALNTAILRHLGLPLEPPRTKLDCDMAIIHTTTFGLLRWRTNAHCFRALADATRPGPGWAWLAVCYSVADYGYSGNALHHVARDPILMAWGDAPYAVALLYWLGCDLYTQKDSCGDPACLALARASESLDLFAPAGLLFEWLQRRDDPDYTPCAETQRLLVCQ